MDLPLDERGGLDPAHPARHAWREEGVQLEAGAEDMLRPEDAHAPYLDAVPRAREAVRQAVEEVPDALDHDRWKIPRGIAQPSGIPRFLTPSAETGTGARHHTESV